jgi:hypothetical protein
VLLGLYVLEKGKVLEASMEKDGGKELKQQQMAQISRVKGGGFESMQSMSKAAASRQARSRVMNTGDRENKSEFAVCMHVVVCRVCGCVRSHALVVRIICSRWH